MPLTAQFQRSLDYHTLSVKPRNETQRKCSIFVNIDCVFSRLYCALIFVFIYIYCFLGCWYNMEVKTIGYVVQYAVHKELCSANLFLDFLFIGTFFNKNFIEVVKLSLLTLLERSTCTQMSNHLQCVRNNSLYVAITSAVDAN